MDFVVLRFQNYTAMREALRFTLTRSLVHSLTRTHNDTQSALRANQMN